MVSKSLNGKPISRYGALQACSESVEGASKDRMLGWRRRTVLAPTFERVLRSGKEQLRSRLIRPDLCLSPNLFSVCSMANITLLVSPSCGACPSAKSLWKQLRVKYSFSYREVDITTKDGQELADRHSVRAVPATIIDGRLTFVGVPSRESAEKALQLKMKQREEG
jgi:glutaredoxin